MTDTDELCGQEVYWRGVPFTEEWKLGPKAEGFSP